MLDLLTSLARKSLILSEEILGEQAMRYRMQETIRQYSAERLSAGREKARVRERHANFFVSLAGDGQPMLAGADQIVWLDRLEIEHDNMRAALDYCAPDSSQLIEPTVSSQLALKGLRLSTSLSLFWEVRGYLAEARSHLRRALDRPDVAALGARPASAASKLVADALCAAGAIAYRQGENKDARNLLGRSLVLSRDLGDRHGIARALVNLGSVVSDQGDYGVAGSLNEESLSIFREIGDRRGTAWALLYKGVLASHQGDYEQARSHLEESLAIRRKIGDK